MRKPLFFLLGLSLMSQLFFACKKDDEQVSPQVTPPATQPSTEEDIVTPTPTSQPGFFVVSSINSSSAANGRKSAESSDSEFDLGPLKASDKFLFMIANGGDEPIFNVTLTTDNTPFEITPKSIQVVPGKKGSAIIPLLTVGVTHGVRLTGVGGAGTAPNLPRGENKATIRMTGKTISGKDTIEVSGEFVVKVNAMVVDAKVLSGDVDALADTSIYNTTVFIVEPSKTVKLVNSGSVPIRVSLDYAKNKVWSGGPNDGSIMSSTWFSNKIELEPNEIKDITSFVSPYVGKIAEEVEDMYFDYYYTGTNLTIKPIKDEGVVVNITYIGLHSM